MTSVSTAADGTVIDRLHAEKGRDVVLMFVSEVMTRGPQAVAPDATAAAAELLMRREQTDALVVVDGDTTVGVLTAADIVEGVTAKGLDTSAVRVRDVCRQLVFTAAPDQEITEVHRFMLSLAVDLVVVLDHGEVVGLLSRQQAATALSGLVP